ncbi:hypothetical protein ACWDBD_37045 [Streptomyces sp. NPDC001118]
MDVALSLPAAEWLVSGRKAVVRAVTGGVLGMAKALANDPITAVEEDLPALCAVLDSAVAVLAVAVRPAKERSASRAAQDRQASGAWRRPGAGVLGERRSAPCS